jgi:hypothetical protein
MSGRDHWLSIARSTDPDDIREHIITGFILTGFKAGKPFTPYVPTIALPPRIDRVRHYEVLLRSKL